MFTFDSQDDALTIARCSVEEGNDWLARNTLDFAKRYKKGELDIVIEFSIGACAEKYHLIFFAVPPGTRYGAAAGYRHTTNMETRRACAHGHQKAMESLPSNPVECPDYVVPSFVWFEAAKQRQNIKREFLAIAGQGIFKVSSGVGNREMDAVNREIGKSVRDGLRDLNLMQLVNAIRIGLNESEVWLFLEELLDSSVKIADVFLSPHDSAFGAD